MAESSSRPARGRILRAGLASMLALTTVPMAALPALSADAPALILHYDFDGDLSGGVVKDSSPSGLDGTLANPGATTTTTGPDGTPALSLPGGATGSQTAPYVTIPNGLFRDRHAMTISAWLKWAGGPDFQWVYNLGKDAATATFVTPSYAGDATMRSSIKPVNGNAEVGVPGAQKLPTGQWVNLVTTIDGKTLTYYVDGVPIGSVAASIDLAAVMHSDTNRTSGYLGKPFWGGHPFLAGDLDDFRVYDGAMDAAAVAGLAGDHLAAITTVDQTSLQITTYGGVAPALPRTVNAQFSDGIRRGVPVTWDAIDPAQYAKPGQFTVKGTAAGAAVQATVQVLSNDLTVDLGTETGAFHGGASGTLYGVYGEGVPSANLLEGMKLRTVATKAQDGPQHPGADALEVVRPLADSTDGDVYIYMTDIYRGFPYEWPGSTPEEKLNDFKAKIAKQVDQALKLDPKYQDNIVFVPFNEPEGNMFGTGTWSYNKISWLSDPQYYFKAWDDVYALIKGKMPEARIAGPNTSVLYDQVKGYLQHVLQAGTVPDVITWHELGDPARIRTDVAKYRQWEQAAFKGTAYEGRQLPINLDEYAFNYHTSVPGQMVQWASAIEESKADADIAYWNIDGNLSDSAVQDNRGNGQWWLLHAYSQMTGDTVKVVPPRPNVSYTLQGVATLDKDKSQARALFGGTSGQAGIHFDHVDTTLFGDTVHALVQEIPWTGQLGDSAQPRVLAELNQKVEDGSVSFGFGSTLPALKEASAYQIILTPGGHATSAAAETTLWQATYEAEKADHTGTGYSVNGPEGTPSDVGKFYTSGGYDVGGMRTGSDVTLNFAVSVPQQGTYDLSVFANSLNTYDAVQAQGPTNVFLRVDGGAEQEIHLPLGYKWVVWDHADTKVALSKGDHTITLATRSLDGARGTKGDAIIDKIDLSLANPAAETAIYEAEYATLDGAHTDYTRKKVSGAGVAALSKDQTATFWVYSPVDGEATVNVDTAGGGRGWLDVNGRRIDGVNASKKLKVFLSGGINKITMTGQSGKLLLDRLRVTPGGDDLKPTWYEAESARIAGTAKVAGYPLASGGKAVTDIGGAPGNANTLTFDVTAAKKGTYALTVRYSNPEQSPASHYNPDPLARHAEISVNGAAPRRTWFPHSFHADNFWELSIPVELKKGANTISFGSQELPNFDGDTYISDTFPDILLRSKYAPIVDKIAVTPFTK
ncbi:Ig-like domain-containing protein [Microbispora sp. RL4-1S]|uniref:Ig-like domain-containing protein n=1 Tax=Microbispora oryzae TaxID=2806554 RepID=A0A941ARH2_9ACTN|nr:LamG-like jellyroll fold domain-containing protein [Microbispora oryzae]MBP2706079.1 Ig-like domain-containing protein [Microbispora oryzae]